MKVTKEKAAENRTALIKAAGALFREHGIDGVGVAEICKAAGLTHGALYAQFPSKEALAAAAFADGITVTSARLVAAKKSDETALTDYLDFLFCRRQRDALVQGCPITASASELARQDETVSKTFVDAFSREVDAIEAALEDDGSSTSRRERAIAIVTAQIGTIVAARAAKKARPKLSDEIITSVRGVAGLIGGER